MFFGKPDHIQKISCSDIWDWELSEDEKQQQLNSYGFIYKVVVDNSSTANQSLSFGFYSSRNAIPAILGCYESHLLRGVITLSYPESGLNPADQASFIHKLVRHPQAKDVEELRIVTRNPFFISDAMSYNVRILDETTIPSELEDSHFFKPDLLKKDFYKVLRNDPYFDKEKCGLYFHNADMDYPFGTYYGECDKFVYWLGQDTDLKLFRTPLSYFWYEMNAIKLTKVNEALLFNMMKDDLEKKTKTDYPTEIFKIISKK